MMTNEDIVYEAMRQSAVDLGANIEDFTKDENVIVKSVNNKNARAYLTLPFDIDLVTYGNNVVASVSDECYDIAKEYVEKYMLSDIFSTPKINVLNEKLSPLDLEVCFMAEYFLPDMRALEKKETKYELRLMEKGEFDEFYNDIDTWSNAIINGKRDVLLLGAYDKGKPIGLAGASQDGDNMWQIGIDVLPDYRRQGVASSLTSNLAVAILERNKVPFYCCAWSNIRSFRNAISSGFRPAWSEMTIKSKEFTAKMK